jgi:hypothetical protein
MQSTDTFKLSDIELAALGTAERLALQGGRSVEARRRTCESSSPFEQQLSKQSSCEEELATLLHGHVANAQ